MNLRAPNRNYTVFMDCFDGAGERIPDGCDPCDFDRDLDVDLSDLIAFQSWFTGTR